MMNDDHANDNGDEKRKHLDESDDYSGDYSADDNDDENDDDNGLYIIGAVCGSVTKVIILPLLPKVPINRRNCVSPISRHFSKVPINRRK